MKYTNLFWNKKKLIKSNSYTLGKQAELRATSYLKKLKYEILENNFKTKLGEIDIITAKNHTITAFEIKQRQDSEILPYVISKKQQQRIANAFLLYLQKNPKYEIMDLQFGAIFINNNTIIEHIENAWEI